MFKKKIVYASILVWSCFVIMGCENQQEEQRASEKADIDYVIEEQTETTPEKAEYDQYMKKIWVSEVEMGRNDMEPITCSFYFTNITNGKVEGRFCTYQKAVKTSYAGTMDELEDNPYLGNFSGNIVDGIAECTFYDRRGYGGRMICNLQDEQRIEVLLEIEEEKSYKPNVLDEYYSGTYIFRPWNIAEETELSIDEEISLETDLDSWGVIQLVSGQMRYADKDYPCIFMTDRNGNIIYLLYYGYINGFKISHMEVRDINGDGLKDISVWMEQCRVKENTVSEDKELQYNFYQQEGGNFWRERIDQIEEKEEIDFQSYVQKIWVADMDKNTDDVYTTLCSFYISDINDHNIEGRFSLNGILEKECFEMESDPKQEISLGLGYFMGEIVDNVAECRFQDDEGNTGRMTITLWDENQIEADMEWIDKHPVYEEAHSDWKEGNYCFRPYNLSDLNIYNVTEISEKLSFETDMNQWGSVRFVPAKVTNVERGNYGACAYLTNSEGDILYSFDTGSNNGMEIADAIVTDVDGDGLKDVCIGMIYTDNMEKFTEKNIIVYERIYYQQKNGLFLYEDKEKTVPYSSLMIY